MRQQLTELALIASDLDKRTIYYTVKNGRERERERERDRERERERERERDSNSRSNSLFYKDCTLGSDKNLSKTSLLIKLLME